MAVSVDAGMSVIAGRMQEAQNGPSLGVDASVGLEVQIGRLAAALERQQRHDQLLAQSVAPVDIPPLDFAVAGGVGKFKAHRAAASLVNCAAHNLASAARSSTVSVVDAVRIVTASRCPTGVSTIAVVNCAGTSAMSWLPGSVNGMPGVIPHPRLACGARPGWQPSTRSASRRS